MKVSRQTARHTVLYWLPAVLWMAVIFAFSAQTGVDSGNLSGGIVSHLLSLWPHWDEFAPATQEQWLSVAGFLVRKGAHFTEYAILGVLLMLAWTHTPPKTGMWPKAALSAAMGLLYASGDEWHQSFVPGRGPAVRDVLIDFSGAVVGVLLFCLFATLKRRRTRISGK